MQYKNSTLPRMSQSFSKSKKTDPLDSKLTFKLTPGPGTYEHINLQPESGKFAVTKFLDSRFCKINPKTPRFLDIKETPGPHTYRHGENLSRNAKYHLSHHPGQGTRAFPHCARNSFTDMKERKDKASPGPGYYDRPSDFGVYGDAKYYKSMRKFKSTSTQK
jgi:hypothetical protein